MRSNYLCLIVCIVCFSTDLEATTTTTIVKMSSTTTTTTSDQQPSLGSDSLTCSSAGSAGDSQLPSQPVMHTKQNELMQINADPVVIQEGISQLTVNCTFTTDLKAEVATVMMMGLYRIRDQAPNYGKQEIAIVTRQKANDDVVGNLSVVRKFNVSGQYFLSISVRNPASKDAGIYKCSLIGSDTSKEPFIATATIPVAMFGDSSSLLPSIQAPLPDKKSTEGIMSDKPADFSKPLEEINSQLQALKSAVETVTQNVSALEKFRQNVEIRLTNMKLSMFMEIVDIKTNYYISLFDFSHVKVAQATCELFGGYLAEIDSLEEFELVVSLVSGVFGLLGEESTLPSDVTEGVLIGGTDEDVEGQWRTRFSPKNLPYIVWSSDSPSKDTSKNCLVMRKNAEWKMTDQPCQNPKSPTKFVCEVPNKK
ncbi:uncharacterized protein LOC106051156 [Biomphalaria glabrata]|uniref:Uncharacterized protein LOC106051156 n=1 Tax=Biomphalaria glabrata TaxID=6526 RepID=A0A9W2YBV2_BIOGL|nr:uncharacterized protein LOC106051156 [Biomphalaria glabrata]